LIEVYNATREKVLARSAAVADTLLARMKGLLGRDRLEEGEGLVIDPCNSIHTFFMRFPIDVLFVDGGGRIVRTFGRLEPNRMTGIYFGARCVVELPAGVLEATATQVGDRIEFRPESPGASRVEEE